MAAKISQVAQIGNPVLRRKSKIVKDIQSKQIQDLIDRMIITMRETDLIGIAAPQVGVDLQIFVTEIRPTALRKSLQENDKLTVFINPKIKTLSKQETILYEGCGSLVHAQLFGPVKRPKQVTIEALDRIGEKFTVIANGLLAKCIQHEYDHIQGIVCIDKFMDTKKVMAREEYLKKKDKKVSK